MLVRAPRPAWIPPIEGLIWGVSVSGVWISDAEVAETTYTMAESSTGAITARLIVRRVKDANQPATAQPAAPPCAVKSAQRLARRQVVRPLCRFAVPIGLSRPPACQTSHAGCCQATAAMGLGFVASVRCCHAVASSYGVLFLRQPWRTPTRRLASCRRAA